eukprot:CAMPEP_0184342708 /NCGR_PEP_ID=MMETSP1089-20130417/11296_1 /TAXON_ID=38269 ORGANISM="Gloeochaete wittrockiana, Strain SAG46.84" /NCGR_SAMPLE_ID=MMETSP1089 /ASSEMBLY_ACC=CAM_ASM_000445 /LENGTH=37 /DNA_ID= /DNA_START= /DNA_END= /DNA_ORIENTATION=
MTLTTGTTTGHDALVAPTTGIVQSGMILKPYIRYKVV